MATQNLAKQEAKLPESLDDLRDLQKKNILETLAILADRSGSMSDPFSSEPGKSKWEAQVEAIKVLWDKTDFSICDTSLFLFDNMADKVEFPTDRPPSLPNSPNYAGGTNFHIALKTALEEAPTRIILISDGESAFPEAQVEICKEKRIPVDTIFIRGDYSGEGQVLLQISEATGGQFTSVENAEQLMEGLALLETSERLLLGHDPDSGNGAIEL